MSTPDQTPVKADQRPILKNSGIKITELRNLTTNETIESTIIDFVKLSSQDRFSAELVLKDIKTAPQGIPSETDNIQVIWTKDDAGKKTTVYRAVAGSVTYDATAAAVKISGLQDVSKFRVSFRGQLAIGPLDAAKKVVMAEASLINVKFGNINKYNEKIIDFSNKEDGQKGTSINVGTLIKWVQGTQGSGDAEMPVDEGKKGDLEKFEITFNDLYLNLDRKTFKIDVQSKNALSIADGIEISNLGLILTNEAPAKEAPVKKVLEIAG